MMMPSIRNSFFNELMNPFDDMFHFASNLFDTDDFAMPKTDVKEVNGNYELDMELPGVKKEDINAKLENGYLTIQATQDNSRDEKDSEGNYIRRERYQGSFSRSFYVGDNVKQEDINASFDQGVLRLTIPKNEIPTEENHYIRIEG